MLLTAATWKYWASGLGAQEMVMAPSSHCELTLTSSGAQGAEGETGEREGQVNTVVLNYLEIPMYLQHLEAHLGYHKKETRGKHF